MRRGRRALGREAQLIRAFAKAAASARAKYAITGAHAVSVWGRRKRAQDIDVIIDLAGKGIEIFVKALRRAGLAINTGDVRTALAQKARFVAFDEQSNYFFEIKGVYRDEDRATLEHRRKGKYDGVVAYFASPEDIIVQKLILGSAQDIEDVRSIISKQKGKLDIARLETMARNAKVYEKFVELK